MKSPVNKNTRIFVAGHRGMVGSAIVRRLQAAGYTSVLTASRDQLDLLDQRAVHAFLAEHRPEHCVVAAAKVGGIAANDRCRADFLYENLLILGNLSSLRDWGHARDYVEMQWLMQQPQPEDFVVATGGQYSVRQFVELAAAELGIRLAFTGQGEQEIGTVTAVDGARAQCKVGDVIVRVDPRYFRPTEVETLLGDPSKAKAKLGWQPTTTLPELVREMVEADFASAKRDHLVRQAGFQAYDHHE